MILVAWIAIAIIVLVLLFKALGKALDFLANVFNF